MTFKYIVLVPLFCMSHGVSTIILLEVTLKGAVISITPAQLFLEIKYRLNLLGSHLGQRKLDWLQD
jgi:hypothetical protein